MLDQNSNSILANDITIYKINYYEWGLNVLEQFCEGEFTFAKRLKFKRQYKTNKSHSDSTMINFVTDIVDITIPKQDLKGSIAVVHGFA